MANFTKTISNSLRAQGPGVASLWGTMVWGTDLWGNTKDTKVRVDKYISDIVATNNIIYSTMSRKVSNTLSCSGGMNLVSLSDGSGYTYVLQGGVTDPDDRLFPSYTSGSLTSPVYTEDSSNSTTWVTA